MTDDNEDRNRDGTAAERDPFEDLGAGVTDREGDPFEGLADDGGTPDGSGVGAPSAVDVENAFEEVDVADIEPDQVWEELEAAESRGSIAEQSERIFAEVPKHTYCEACKWFSEPPEVACGHEGTDIVEFTDLETVRVVDCPIVEERRDLQGD